MFRAGSTYETAGPTITVVTTLALLTGAFAPPPATAGPPQPSQAYTRPAPTGDGRPGTRSTSTVPAEQRDRVLAEGWRTSPDRAMTTFGDEHGLHLLVADANTGYTWRTAATLTEPAIEADSWVGNACLTGSGRRAVVAYQPRHFTNREHLFSRGAFAAVVDLDTGGVTKLGIGVSIAYYNPGCGAGETAVLTQSAAVDAGRTRLHLLDAARGQVTRSHELSGQITSAVPFQAGIAAADGARVIAVAPNGTEKTLAENGGAASHLRADRAGGLAFLRLDGHLDGDASAVIGYLRDGKSRDIARGPLADIGLSVGGGNVYLTGSPATVADLPQTVRRLGVSPRAEVSTHGQATIIRPPRDAATAEAVQLRALFPGTGRTADFRIGVADRVPDRIDEGRTRSPLLPSPRATAGPATGLLAAGSPTDPVESDRT